MSQFELTLMPSGNRLYQDRFCPVLLIFRSIESLPVLLTSVATTQGGKLPRVKLAMLPSGAPVYLISGNVPVCRPNAVMLITMLLPDVERVPLTLIAGLAGFTLNVP